MLELIQVKILLYKNIFILISEIGCIICTICILNSKKLIHDIVCLIFIYIFATITLYHIGLSEVGLIYILVYVGAITILFLFIISLINLKYIESSLTNNHSDKLLMFITTIIIIITTYIYLNVYYLYNDNTLFENINNNDFINNNYKLINILPTFDTYKLLIIAQYYYVSHPILFILLGLILLLAIIAVIVLIK